MTNKKCNDNCTCSHVDAKHTGEKETINYGFYSNVLKKPFERLDDLKKAEYVYFEEQKLKEDKAAQKKADAKVVDDAFKALNTTRRVYKEAMTTLVEKYNADLKELKASFEKDRKDVQAMLAEAENVYAAALKAFTDKYETYHLSLRDGDFETTIDSKTTVGVNKQYNMFDIFDWIFNN